MNWPLVKLKDVVEINIGRTPSRNNPDYWGKGNAWLSIRDMNQGKKLATTSEQITDLAIEETGCNLAKKGTVLFSFKLSIGKVGITNIDMYHNEAIAAMPIKDGVELCEKYLYFALLQVDTLQSSDRAVMGATLNKKKMAELEIPLPPLGIQKQIVSILEQADQLRKYCQKMEQEFNCLAQSLFLDMFGDPVSNPKEWETVSLESLARVQIGPFGSQLHKEDYISGGIPLINPTHIVNGEIVPDYTLTLTQEKYDELTNYHLKVGDIIMGRRGEMARTALVDEISSGWFCGTGSLYVRIKNNRVQSEYLNSVLSCGAMKIWLEKQSLGATMSNLNKKILHSIQVPLPPESLQKKYAKTLEELINKKMIQKSYQEELELLFQSLITKAFRGELKLKEPVM